MVKAKKSTKTRPAPLCRFRVRSSLKFEGATYMKFAPKKGITPEGKVVTYMKFAPKKGITPEGKVVSLTDATLVEPVS